MFLLYMNGHLFIYSIWISLFFEQFLFFLYALDGFLVMKKITCIYIYMQKRSMTVEWILACTCVYIYMCICICICIYVCVLVYVRKKWKGLMHFPVIESLAFVACQFILKFCRSWLTFYLYLMTFPQENVRVFHCKRVGGVRSINKSGLCEFPLFPCIFSQFWHVFQGCSSPAHHTAGEWSPPLFGWQHWILHFFLPPGHVWGGATMMVQLHQHVVTVDLTLKCILQKAFLLFGLAPWTMQCL